MEQEFEIILAKYSIIKGMFIECEETDPELKTNMQPLNEFRAILDHMVKLIFAHKQADEAKIREQLGKLNGHLDRCFFDVCDMLGINYRNKINDVLGLYDVETIRTVLPTYYSEIKPKLEEVNGRICSYREKKGLPSLTQEDTADLYDEYRADILMLRDAYTQIIRSQGALEEVKYKKQIAAEQAAEQAKKAERKAKIWDFIVGGLIGAVISGVLVALIINWFGL